NRNACQRRKKNVQRHGSKKRIERVSPEKAKDFGKQKWINGRHPRGWTRAHFKRRAEPASYGERISNIAAFIREGKDDGPFAWPVDDIAPSHHDAQTKRSDQNERQRCCNAFEFSSHVC